MKVVPLQPTPAQRLSIQLADQPCQLRVFQKMTGLYCDVYVNNSLIIGGVLCHNLNRLVKSEYLGFQGDLLFIDNQGLDDPDYTGLGDRFDLIYVEASELL